MDKNLEKILAYIKDYIEFYNEESDIYFVLQNLLRNINTILKNRSIEEKQL